MDTLISQAYELARIATSTADTDNEANATNALNLLTRAIAIADHSVRSDVELYAHSFFDEAGIAVYDTTKHAQLGGSPEDLVVVARAMAYIDARADSLPFLMKRQLGATHLVRFEAKP